MYTRWSFRADLLAIAEERTRLQNTAQVHIETISNMKITWASIMIPYGVDFGTSAIRLESLLSSSPKAL